MNTHENYCSLQTCKLLKQAGFDWECNESYRGGRTEAVSGMYINWNSSSHEGLSISAPTLSVAQRWLREVKVQYVLVYPIKDNWFYSIMRPNFGRYYRDKQFDNYEKALEAGIKKALELILEKGE